MRTKYNGENAKIINIEYEAGTNFTINSASEHPNNEKSFRFDLEYDCGIIISSDEIGAKELIRIEAEYDDYVAEKNLNTEFNDG